MTAGNIACSVVGHINHGTDTTCVYCSTPINPADRAVVTAMGRLRRGDVLGALRVLGAAAATP